MGSFKAVKTAMYFSGAYVKEASHAINAKIACN